MTRSSHFLGLDWLRGLAALLVFAMHVELSVGSTRVFDRGYLAVDLFFVLSGFVVANSYEATMQEPFGLRKFSKIRFIRLYPLALLGSVVGILTWQTGHFQTDHILLVMVCQALLIPQIWQGSSLFLMNSVHWSLMLEVLANIAHALGIKRLNLPILAGIVFVGWLGIFASAWHWGNLSVGYGRTNAWGGVARLVFAYPSGVLICRLHRAGQLPKLRVPRPLLVVLPLVLLLPGIPTLSRSWIVDPIMVTALPIMLIVALASEFPRSLYDTAKTLGNLSYPLYAIHLPLVFGSLHLLALAGLNGVARSMAIAGMLVGILGISLLIYYCYDAPARRWLSRRLEARRAFNLPASAS